MAGVGKLTMTVWPAYIGAALEGATPPFSINEPHNGGYERGQIHWYPAKDGMIVGRARVLCPPGVYTHFVYFKHPTLPQACGVAKMAHSIRFTEPLTVLDVDPIVNSDLALSRMEGIHP
jgi:hypothetical protein